MLERVNYCSSSIPRGRYNAHADIGTALSIACTNQDDRILGRLLARQAHTDPEYKINKAKLDHSLERHVSGGSGGTQPGSGGGAASTGTTGRNITYSNIFPTQAVMVNWHLDNCQLAHVK